jgi:hypothetical protein
MQQLSKMNAHASESLLPKVKRVEDFHAHGLASQLSTITEKDSEENLHNYLRKGHKGRSKSNINKVFFKRFRTFTITFLR